MMDEFRPDYDPLANRSGNPYRDEGQEVGNLAHDLLDYLSQPLVPEQRQDGGWYEPESDALAVLVSLDWIVPHIRAGGEVSIDEMEAFDTRLAAFRAALPLTDPERHWLVKVVGAVDANYAQAAENLGEREDDIISAGMRQRVSGRDLLRRWHSWRMETDEYAGQGTLDLAREALRGVVQLILPDEPLPKSYRELRDLLDPPQGEPGKLR
jgi:hypothetical protein